MIELQINTQQIERAKQHYEFNELKNSITKGQNNIFGALGEIVFYDYYKNQGKDINHVGSIDYDYKLEGYKIEIKTKKVFQLDTINVKATVAAYNTRQDCDFYFFIQVSSDMQKAWLLGYMPKVEFYQKATFNKLGEKDTNGFEFKADCYNLKVNDLKRF
jgi:hypothetical protein